MLSEKINKFKSQITDNPSFTVKEQVGYASGIFGNCMGQDSVQTFSDKFFRNFMGIENRFMTIMSNILTAFGLIFNPIAGNIVDSPIRPDQKRTPTKKILMITPLPFAISSMLLYIVPFSSSFKNFLWALLVKLVFNTVDAFYDMSLNTMSLRMTTNAKDRKNFYTVATLASSLGSMLPGWLIPLVVGSTNDHAQQRMFYFVVSLIFCVLGVISMYAPYFTLNEKIRVVEREEDKDKEKKSVISWDKKTIKTMLHTRSFIVVQIANFFEQIRQISYTLLPYIYDDVFADFKMKAFIDIISGTLSYVGLFAVPFLGSRFSARTIVGSSFGFTGTMYTLMSLFTPRIRSGMSDMEQMSKLQSLRKIRYVIGVMIGIAGMPNNAIAASKKIIVGDATDYMEWYSEKTYGTPIRSEGLISATQSTLGTVNTFVRQNVYNILFSLIRYQPSRDTQVIQTPSTLKGLYLMFTMCGIVGNFFASGSYFFDNYTGKRKERILEELAEFRAAREKAVQEFMAEEKEAPQNA